MEFKFEIADLQKKKLFLATPMYGGQCFGNYTRSIADLSVFCSQHGIGMKSYFLFNESLITRARNYCVDEFLRSDCTHFLFIDSDIGFNPKDVIVLLGLQDTEEGDYDVITAPYPKKCITWEKVKAAVDQGKADEDPNELDNYVGDFVLNPVKGQQFRIDQPVEVMEAGTGFMMIRRKTFEQFMEAYPELMYKPDHVRTDHFDGSREIGMFFQAEVDPESKRYLSEDYWFCQMIRKAGMKLWMCPWMHLTHSGHYVFAGSLGHLAQIGASATTDVKLIKKKK